MDSNDREWMYSTFNRLQQSHKARTIANDYFEGATLFRVFYFDIHDQATWKDLYATDKAEAEELAVDEISDLQEIDQIIPSPQQ